MSSPDEEIINSVVKLVALGAGACMVALVGLGFGIATVWKVWHG